MRSLSGPSRGPSALRHLNLTTSKWRNEQTGYCRDRPQHSERRTLGERSLMKPNHDPPPWEPLSGPSSRSSEPGTGFSAAPPPSAAGAQGSGDRDRRTSPANDVLSPSDLEVLQILYSFIVRESLCAVCRHPLRTDLRIDVHDVGARGAWIASVSSGCCGWRRHPHEAMAWLSEDGLRMEQFRFRT